MSATTGTPSNNRPNVLLTESPTYEMASYWILVTYNTYDEYILHDVPFVTPQLWKHRGVQCLNIHLSAILNTLTCLTPTGYPIWIFAWILCSPRDHMSLQIRSLYLLLSEMTDRYICVSYRSHQESTHTHTRFHIQDIKMDHVAFPSTRELWVFNENILRLAS